MRRVILTTGGTGGHIFPALAVAEEIRKRHPQAEILFVGSSYGPEKRLAESAGLKFAALPARGVLGRGLKAVGSLFRIGLSVLRSFAIVRNFRPDVAVGFGGYAGFSAVCAASLMGVPTAVHEQNSFPGSTNRVLARWVDRVLASFPDEQGFFPKDKLTLTGNPVRECIRALGGREAGQRETRRLLIAGGSLGAMAVNSAVLDALPELKEMGIEVWHQTGKLDFERVGKAYREAGMDDCRVEPFIDDMAAAYGWADLLLCRAGATTLAELTVAGKPSVLVPFPYATHDHQTVNANFLMKRGAALMIPQDSLGDTGVAKVVAEIFNTPGRLGAMAAAAKQLGKPDAAANVADELEKLAASRKG